MFGWIASKVLGSAFGKLFGGFLDYRNQKSVIEAGILTSVIESDIEINKMKMQMAALNKEWWVTRWIMPGFAYITMAHYGAVVADSIFLFDWNVAALPGSFANWEGEIILSFFIIGTTQSLIKQWMNRGLVSSVIQNVKSIIPNSKNRGGRNR